MKIYLEKVRIEKRLTLSELSRQSGVAVSHIYNIEKSIKAPTIPIMCKLAKTLKVPCSDLFTCDEKDLK